MAKKLSSMPMEILTKPSSDPGETKPDVPDRLDAPGFNLFERQRGGSIKNSGNERMNGDRQKTIRYLLESCVIGFCHQ